MSNNTCLKDENNKTPPDNSHRRPQQTDWPLSLPCNFRLSAIATRTYTLMTAACYESAMGLKSVRMRQIIRGILFLFALSNNQNGFPLLTNPFIRLVVCVLLLTQQVPSIFAFVSDLEMHSTSKPTE